MTEKFLIITCGLIGTGKSSIAQELAKRLNLKLISSDYVRKELAGIEPKEHLYENFGKGMYSKDFTEKTYQRIFKLAKEYLMQNKSVILDASFTKRSHRTKAYELAKELNADFLCIELICAKEELRKRLVRRVACGTDVSDGRLEILPQQEAEFEKVIELPSEMHIVIDTGAKKEKSVNAILAVIKAHATT